MTQESKLVIGNKVSNVADRSISRMINQKAIINQIYHSNGISKAQLAKDLGISKPAVASNVDELMELGLVEEIGEGKAAKTGGRRPVMLYFNKNCKYVGALDLSFREPVCAISDLYNNIIGLKKIKVGEQATIDERRATVKQAFLDILKEREIPLNRLGIIMISHPGVIEEAVEEHYSEKQHHHWTEVGIGKYLKEELGVPVSIKNDVNLAAVGEINYGLDKSLNNLIYVSCGVGLGAGIIIDGKLYTGSRNAAGEIGSMLMEDGKRYEDYVAMEGLIQRVEKDYKPQNAAEKITFNQIVKLSNQKNSAVEKIIYHTGQILGRILYNCCSVLDISTVIFGGEYLQLGDKLFEGIENVLSNSSVFRPEVLASDLKEIAGICGCFVVGKDMILEDIVANAAVR